MFIGGREGKKQIMQMSKRCLIAAFVSCASLCGVTHVTKFVKRAIGREDVLLVCRCRYVEYDTFSNHFSFNLVLRKRGVP